MWPMLEYIKHPVTQKAEREMTFPRCCQGKRKTIPKKKEQKKKEMCCNCPQ